LFPYSISKNPPNPKIAPRLFCLTPLKQLLYTYYMTSKTHITSNKAKCLRCLEIIESKHRRDFVQCQCGAIFVDGGKDYLRRGGALENLEELSTFAEDTKKDTPLV
jgi:hypothetical protein